MANADSLPCRVEGGGGGAEGQGETVREREENRGRRNRAELEGREGWQGKKIQWGREGAEDRTGRR